MPPTRALDAPLVPPVRVGAVLGSELPGAFSSVAPPLCLPADRGTGPRVQSEAHAGLSCPCRAGAPSGVRGPLSRPVLSPRPSGAWRSGCASCLPNPIPRVGHCLGLGAHLL